LLSRCLPSAWNSGGVRRNNTLVATNFFLKLWGTVKAGSAFEGWVDVHFAAKGNLGVMRATAGLIPAIAVSVMALAIGSLGSGSARAQETHPQDAHPQDTHAQETRAQDNCLAAPSGKAPQGSHWRYHTDAATQTKCWNLRTDADPAQKSATPDKPEPAVAATAPAAATPKAAPDQTTGPEGQQPRPAKAARAAPGGKPTQSSAQNDRQGGAQANNQAGNQDSGRIRRQGGDSAAPWPDPPPSQGSAANVPWPDPVRLAAGGTPPTAIATQPPPPALANNQQEPPAPAQSSVKASGNDAASDRQAAEPIATAVSDNDEMPVGLLLALAISMLIAGILVRRIVKMLFARRRRINPERREPVLRTNSAGERTITLPVAHQRDLAPGWVDRLDEDVQESLRHLLRTLERQAA
jgi:hypothetical protein